MKKNPGRSNPPPQLSWSEKMDQRFAGKEKSFFILGLSATIMVTFLLFEPKVSIGGDDSMYINRAFNFIQDGTFPSFQGPLYPLVLSAFIAVLGINVLALKMLSVLFMAGHFVFSFRLFSKYLSPFLLVSFTLLISFSGPMLAYGSTTYSEAFYMCIQSIFLFWFDRYFLSQPAPDKLRFDKAVILTAVLLFLLFLTRNVGLVALLAVLVYFSFQKYWKTAISVFSVFVMFFLLYQFMKIAFWDISDTQISGQGSTLLMKNSFKPELGNETFSGFLERLMNNSVYYLGFHLFNIFGISSGESLVSQVFIALIVYLLLVQGLLMNRTKSPFWFFTGLYILITCLVTFLALQTYWNQERLIVIVAPMLMALLLYTLNRQFTTGLRPLSWIFMIFISILLFANLLRTITTIPKQLDVLSHYVKGQDLYGYPLDWQNYLSMVRWSSKNLPPDAYVACRKPDMAFIYSNGKNFYGIWRVPSNDPDELYNALKNVGVTHVIMASLRTNPDLEESTLINTVRVYLQIINEAFPGKLELVHTEGEKWPVYLYKIN